MKHIDMDHSLVQEFAAKHRVSQQLIRFCILKGWLHPSLDTCCDEFAIRLMSGLNHSIEGLRLMSSVHGKDRRKDIVEKPGMSSMDVFILNRFLNAPKGTHVNVIGIAKEVYRRQGRIYDPRKSDDELLARIRYLRGRAYRMRKAQKKAERDEAQKGKIEGASPYF